jgi:hypothetical protein
VRRKYGRASSDFSLNIVSDLTDASKSVLWSEYNI